jgi:hypothetical protein
MTTKRPGWRVLATLMQNHHLQVAAFLRGDYAQALALASSAVSFIEAEACRPDAPPPELEDAEAGAAAEVEA